MGQRSRATVLAVVGLLLLPLAVELLWGIRSSSPESQGRLSPGDSPFPAFPSSSHIVVVPVTPETNASTRLTLVSVQGLANRVRAEVYLDFDDELGDPASILMFVVQEYNLTYEVLEVGAALSRYLPGVSGLVAVDPGRPESVNIATMYAANRSAALAGPDTVAALSQAYDLPILLDYATSDWATLGAIQAYDRALGELYPACTKRLLSIYAPDWIASRDYLIAARAFVFYHAQGALASPWEVQATARILQATPRGIPVIGWFRSPTLTEENAFVQLASREGKLVVGAQDVPNLSLLTAIGRGSVWQQSPAPAGPSALEDKTYAVVAIPDGDNVAFVEGRMRELWRQPERGTFPIAWSISPLLAELAPPLLSYFGRSAAPTDRFVAAPSGAGYVYPDYMDPGDLLPYLARSREFLNATGLDVVWLLNAFVATEIPHSPGVIEAYADELRPRGLVLDYDDAPRSADYWVEGRGVPVIRATHLWTTRENLFGKVAAARDAWGPGPRFLWLTVYPFTYDLADVRASLEELSARLKSRLEVVTPERFFSLLESDFVARARSRLRSAGNDPIAATFLGPYLSSAAGHVASAEAHAAAGRTREATLEASLALDDLQLASTWEALGFASLAVVGTASFAAHRRRDLRAIARRAVPRRGPMAIFAATVLFMFAIRSALDANFWTYHFVLLGSASVALAGPVRRHLDLRYSRHSLTVGVLLDLVVVALAVLTSAAFPLAVLGTLIVMTTVLGREPMTAESFAVAFLFGMAAGFVAPLGGFSIGAASLLLLLSTLGLRGKAVGRGPVQARGWVAGLTLALPIVALAPAMSYSLALRLELQGAVLVVTSATSLALAVLAAATITFRAPVPMRALRIAGFLAAIPASLALLAIRGTVPATLAVVGLAASLSVAAIATLRAHSARGEALSAALPVAIGLTPILLLALRMPPVAYSLVLVAFPEPLEYAWYAPQILVASGAAACAALLALRWTRGKDYRPVLDTVREGPG